MLGNWQGQIVGSYVSSDGFSNGFVATPIPEPGSLALFTLGFLTLAV